MYKVWVGNRESEILTYNIFNESITFFGSNKLKNHAFSDNLRINSNYGTEFTDFVVMKIESIIKRNVNVEFHFYNPVFAHKILTQKPLLKKYFVNINCYETLKWVNSKTFVRGWVSNSVPVPSYALLSRTECSLTNLKTLFKDSSKFIIQKDVSGGGQGTYLLTSESETDVLKNLNKQSLYLVSPYYSPKITYCCHMLIGNKNVAIFPFGTQLSELYGNKILYKGTCYHDKLILDSKIKQELFNYAISIGKNLQGVGYRGICGLDFILHKKQCLFIEVNARYLGSSFLINKALYNNNLPSLFELNSLCFSNDAILPCSVIRKLKVNYASNVIKSGPCLDHKYIKEFIKNAKVNISKEIFLDGLDNAKEVSSNTYLCREIINTSSR